MKIQIEILDFEESCRHRTLLAHKKIKDGMPAYGYPTIVLVSGKGVISKSYEKDRTIVQRVSGNEGLYYSCNDGTKEISFIRKEQVDCEIAQFSNVLYIKICAKADDAVIGEVISEFYGQTYTFRNLLKYGEDSKIILSHLVKKAEIPLLISVFLVLLLNFFVNAHFSELNNRLQTQLTENRKNIGNADSQLKDMQKLVTENVPNRCMDASLMIDLLASQIPDGITVNLLAVDPLKRKVEAQKPLTLEKNTVLIKGETASANDITIMTNNIGNLDFQKNVKIKNIQQKRDSEMLEFEIEVGY